MWSFFSRDPSKEFNYEILEQVSGTEEYLLWKLHKGKKKGTGESVSVFILDAKTNGSDTQIELAKSALKRLKTLRHPNILTYIDSLETEKCLYLVTEYVEPLQFHLNSYSTDFPKSKQQKELFIAWGLFQVVRALKFLNNDGNLQHNSICLGNILVNTAGEWKLGGFENATPSSLMNSLPIKILPSFEKYDPPEKVDSSKLKSATKWSADMWGFGCLIWEVFNGSLKSSSSLKAIGNIPKQLASVYCELVGANPSSRPNPSDVLIICRKSGGYFHNDLVECLLFLEEIQIKENTEKAQFFNKLPSLLDSFPENLSRHKVLPQLINAFEFGNAGAAILTPLFKLGSLLSEDEYQKKIVPCVVKLFSSPDRATRVRLLQQLEQFSTHLLPVTVNEHIFPHILSGFTDSNPVIREHTVKSIMFLAPKLNYNNLNVEVLKHFARLQSKDEQGGIRTNTTVCLGKVASFLHPQVRQKVLVSAFTRALRDPFPPARIGGILALAATQQYYLLSQISHQVLPAMCVLMGDPEREVRDQAFKVIKGFISKLEKVSEDPSLRECMEADVNANASPNVTDMASTWAGWAVSAVTSKFYKSQGSQLPDQGSSLPAGSQTTTGARNPSAVETTVETRKRPDSESNEDSVQWGNINELSLTSNTVDDKEDGDGWDIQEDWAPIENFEQESFATKATNIREKASVPMNTNPENDEGAWESTWNTNNWSTSEGNDKDESRKKREEKRILRQKEIEAKRSARQGASSGGALKLGGKRM
ncbi:N-terminal kinase-like protein [Daphnia carinata]|uniref:N-terminal kinase-like protein n=1 Tax=Daphnia carinata TaxID=120202 RepID=UPI00257F5AAD|nr:N-terminal kinase-like protein [Daphnia carinata]